MYTKYHMESSQDKESAVLELKLKALQLDIIYHISVVEQLLESEVTSVEDWHWQRRLRYFNPVTQVTFKLKIMSATDLIRLFWSKSVSFKLTASATFFLSRSKFIFFNPLNK